MSFMETDVLRTREKYGLIDIDLTVFSIVVQ